MSPNAHLSDHSIKASACLHLPGIRVVTSSTTARIVTLNKKTTRPLQGGCLIFFTLMRLYHYSWQGFAKFTSATSALVPCFKSFHIYIHAGTYT